VAPRMNSRTTARFSADPVNGFGPPRQVRRVVARIELLAALTSRKPGRAARARTSAARRLARRAGRRTGPALRARRAAACAPSGRRGTPPTSSGRSPQQRAVASWGSVVSASVSDSSASASTGRWSESSPPESVESMSSTSSWPRSTPRGRRSAPRRLSAWNPPPNPPSVGCTATRSMHVRSGQQTRDNSPAADGPLRVPGQGALPAVRIPARRAASRRRRRRRGRGRGSSAARSSSRRRC
jgi:hypothetical protein